MYVVPSHLAGFAHLIRAFLAYYFTHPEVIYHWLNLKCVAGHVQVFALVAPSPLFFFYPLSRSEMAPPGPNTPCRLFKSEEGCRYGNRCKFSHDLTSTPRTRGFPQPSRHNAPSSSTSATPRTRSGRNGTPVPRNVCDFYWSTGQCNRGFDCTFKHQKNIKPQAGEVNATGRAEAEEDTANTALEFFTVDNLTQMAGVGLHSAQEGTPENAHNSIKRYLGGGPLADPSAMRPLASILASVNRRNHSWVRVVPSPAPDGY